MLSPSMTAMWKRGGGQWSAVSSRIISARIQFGLKGERLRNGQRRRSDFFVTILNIYAPTNKAPPHVKLQFGEELRSVMDSASASDVLLMLGDFNARVGSNRLVSSTPSRFDGVANDGALWGRALGLFGLGACNQAGEDLLMFCNSNGLSIMNTNYKKKESRRGTWTHPATRQSHLIDYIIMRADQRCCCEDVSVVRGAACWTDHFIVRAKLNLEFITYRRPATRMRPYSVHLLRDSASLLEYQTQMGDVCVAASADSGRTSIEEDWSSLRDDIAGVSAEVLGHGKQRQPDWFLSAQSALGTTLAEQQVARQQMLLGDTPDSRKSFRLAQPAVTKAVHKAKEDWIESVAKKADAAGRDGCVRWKCIGQLRTL